MDKQIDRPKRILWLDILKCLAIFFVLWGHSIALLQEGKTHWSNGVYAFIYGFHMPLFMIISGFFGLGLLKDSPLNLFKKKTLQLLVPVVIYGTIAWFLDTFEARTSGISLPMAIGFRYLWFLKSLFICICLFYITFRILKGKIWIILLSLVISQLIEYFNVRYMYPCFLWGYFLFIKFELIKKYALFIAVTTLTIYLILYGYWSETYHDPAFSLRVVYSSLIDLNYKVIIHQIILGYFKLFFGIVGATSIFCIAYLLFSIENKSVIQKKINQWGRETLGIYLLQTIVLETLLPDIFIMEYSDTWIRNFILFPLISLAILIICGELSKLLSINKCTIWLINPSLYLQKKRSCSNTLSQKIQGNRI